MGWSRFVEFKIVDPLQPIIFNFWKGNKVSGHFQMNATQLKSKFLEWMPTRDLAWHEYYGISDCVNAFISDALDAIGNTENDFSEYRHMETLLKPVRREYLNKIPSQPS